MANYSSNLIPGSFVFCGETYTVDSSSFSVRWDSHLSLKCHSVSGDRCCARYDFYEQMDPDQQDSLEDIRYDNPTDKQVYADAVCKAIDFSKPSYILNNDQLYRIYPDGHKDSDGLVEDFNSSVVSECSPINFSKLGIDINIR